jgi:hypothetical protein
MIFGVLCNTEGKISFDDCERCAKCLPRPLIKAIKPIPSEQKSGYYGVKEINDCLRKAFFRRTEKRKDVYLKLSSYLASKRGKYYEEILEDSGWNELPIELELDIDGESVYLRGIIDCYDASSGSIVELKTCNLEQVSVPRASDILQIKSYYSIGKKVNVLGQVNILKIVYTDMSRFKTVNISPEDISDWLINRTRTLHKAISNINAPRKEQTKKCLNCAQSKICSRYSKQSDQPIDNLIEIPEE